MPTYDYQCTKCEHVQERVLSMNEVTEKEPDPCDECGSETRRVILSAPRTIYKGQGWFKTTGGYEKTRKNKVNSKEVEHYEATGQAGF